MQHQPCSTLFPYTTLFRSIVLFATWRQAWAILRMAVRRWRVRNGSILQERPARSEEHTSELQSRENLVCRLLLEKKKNSPHKVQRININTDINITIPTHTK